MKPDPVATAPGFDIKAREVSLENFFWFAWYYVKKLLGPQVLIPKDLILNACRESDREAMIATISRTLPDIESQQILASQIFFDRLKDRTQINGLRAGRER